MSNLHRSTRHVVPARRAWAIAVAALCALAPLAIAGTTEAATVTVVVNGGLTPQALTVVVGTTVTWQMTDGDKHRIRSVTAPAEFDSGGIDPGGSYSRTFGTAGTITYRDEEQKDSAAYSGTITVVTNDPTAPPVTTTPPPATPGPTTPAGPVQVRIANRAFTPSPEELDRANRLIAAYEQANARGEAAIAFEGQMVDEPLARHARAVIAAAADL